VKQIILFVPGEVWSINAERSMHHHARALLVKPMRHLGMLVARNVINSASDAVKFTVPVAVTFRPFQKNLGPTADTANHIGPCKAVLDGVVDAGLIQDDTPEYVVSQTFLPPVRVPATATGIEITLTPILTPTP
jgi:hypothetical protein